MKWNPHSLRNFILEMVIYGACVVVYFLLVLRFLGEPLAQLFKQNTALYGVIALILIVAQAVLLEVVTTWIITRLGVQRLE